MKRSSGSSPETPRPRSFPDGWDRFDQSVHAFCETNRLFSPGDRVIVAVSGGIDSVSLLHWLLRSPWNLRLVVAHLNHSLRGDESDLDADFVRRLAAEWGLPFHLEKVDVRALCRRESLSLEEGGRKARYRFFAEIREQLGGGSVAVAHHADDQAETILMRLLRGSGGRGLSGMLPRDMRGIVRPFLPATRVDIRRYAARWGLTWREDLTNTDTVLSLRNRIRHHLLPILREYNPRIDERLITTAAILADDESLLEEESDRILSDAARREGDRLVFDWDRIPSHPAIRRRIIRRGYALVTGSTRRLGFGHVESCIALAERGASGEIFLPSGVVFVISCGIVSIGPGGGRRMPMREIIVTRCGVYPLDDSRTVVISPADCPTPGGGDPGDVTVSLERYPFPWRIRRRREGDRVMVPGLGRKSLKKLFAEKGVPRWERDYIPLFESAQDIFLVPGVTPPGGVSSGSNPVRVRIAPAGMASPSGIPTPAADVV